MARPSMRRPSMPRPSLHARANDPDAAVTPLELFFDLVFVFALTEVTAMMAHDLTGEGMVRGLLVVGLLWWCWVGYSWLGNVVRADEGPIKVLLLVAMAAMFVLALSIREAFHDIPGGLSGPVVVAVCYFLFRLMHIVLFWIIARGDGELRRQLLLFAPSMLGGTTLLLVASQTHGAAQTWLWAGAIVADYGGTYLAGAHGWRLRSAVHFAERHGLIVIIALGESIVAIGVGMSGEPISVPVITAAVLGLALAAAMWWAYFDVSAAIGEQALAAEPEETRSRLARDAYTFLHLPLAAGIVLVALGLKKVLEYVADSTHHELADPLTPLAVYALYGGAALYLLGHVAFKRCTAGYVFWPRVAVGVLIVVLIPVGVLVPALAALAVLTVVVVVLMVFETVRYAELRDAIRHGRHEAAPGHS